MVVVVDGVLPMGGLGSDLSHSCSSVLAAREILHGWVFTRTKGVWMTGDAVRAGGCSLVLSLLVTLFWCSCPLDCSDLLVLLLVDIPIAGTFISGDICGNTRSLHLMLLLRVAACG